MRRFSCNQLFQVLWGQGVVLKFVLSRKYRLQPKSQNEKSQCWNIFTIFNHKLTTTIMCLTKCKVWSRITTRPFGVISEEPLWIISRLGTMNLQICWHVWWIGPWMVLHSLSKPQYELKAKEERSLRRNLELKSKLAKAGKTK